MPGSEAVYVHREPGESWGRVLQTGNLFLNIFGGIFFRTIVNTALSAAPHWQSDALTTRLDLNRNLMSGVAIS